MLVNYAKYCLQNVLPLGGRGNAAEEGCGLDTATLEAKGKG